MEARGIRARLLEAARGAWLDLLYPPLCRLCAAPAEDGFACAAHRLPLAPAGPRCGSCRAALAPAIADGEPCPACRARRPRYGRLEVLFDYRECAAGREWVLAFKHGGRGDLARPLAARLAQALAARGGLGARALLVPVPLHPLRRLERGYDQAFLLAEALSTRLDLPLARLVRRRRHTAVQGALGSPARHLNVAEAFVARSAAAAGFPSATLWLVDDVVTSGATLEECARALRRAGARRIGALALARAGS